MSDTRKGGAGLPQRNGARAGVGLAFFFGARSSTCFSGAFGLVLEGGLQVEQLRRERGRKPFAACAALSRAARPRAH